MRSEHLEEGNLLPQQRFTKCELEFLTVEKLTDGSTAIVDNRFKTVHSLNPSATAVWDACGQGATFEQIQSQIADSFGTVDASVIRQALDQLQSANLIEAAPRAMENIDLGRRNMLKRAGAAGAFAIPVVLTLTASEQRAYAAITLSGTTTPAPTTTFAPPR